MDKSEINTWVNVGDFVYRGQQVGIIGPTPVGSTAPHLHFEMRTDRNASPGPGYKTDNTGWRDPSDYIDAHRPDPASVTPLMSEYIYAGIIHAEQPDDSDDGRRVYNQYYIDSRATFIRILIQSLEELAGKVILVDEPVPFSDVSIDDWFHDDVLKAYNLGIIADPADNKFHPTEPINRIEALAFTTRVYELYLGEIEVPISSPAFTDVTDPVSWMYEIVQKGSAAGLTQGYMTDEGRYFYPARWVIRSESVAFVDKLISQMIGCLLGDVDCNDCVDMDDIIAIRNAINTDDCPECDINGDGEVTFLDVRKAITRCDRPLCLPCRE